MEKLNSRFWFFFLPVWFQGCDSIAMASETDEKAKMESLTSAAAFVEGGIQDACNICLEAFCESDPSAVSCHFVSWDILHIKVISVTNYCFCLSSWLAANMSSISNAFLNGMFLALIYPSYMLQFLQFFILFPPFTWTVPSSISNSSGCMSYGYH